MADPGRRAAVLGSPIAHSLSPVLHGAAYRALGLDWQYTAIECVESQLAGVLAERSDWAGFSCTMPLKRAALAVADEVRPIAGQVGAANTLLPLPGGGWAADNTDVAGIVATLQVADARSGTAALLGAGGTAQAAVAALAELGVACCTVLVRDPARTTEVRATADAVGLRLDIEPLAVDAPALDADLVVSTLPGRAADAFAERGWRAGQTVLDVLYDPWPTALAAGAARGGARALGGVLVLMHQAAAQVRLMTGQAPPLAALRTALLERRPALAGPPATGFGDLSA